MPSAEGAMASAEASPTKPPPTVLLTTVDIGGGRSDKIEIRKGDNPAEIARSFCERHSLPEAVLTPLTEHLLENLRKASRSLSEKRPQVSCDPANGGESGGMGSEGGGAGLEVGGRGEELPVLRVLRVSMHVLYAQHHTCACGETMCVSCGNRWQGRACKACERE
eukprot:365441-Chlamydomonas_euryale.AAC.4